MGRHTLRVALNRLAALGLVEIRKSEGTFVNSVISMSFSEPLKEMLEEKVRNVESFLEVRKVLESWAANLAAEKATGEHLAKLERALGQMEVARDSGELVAKADMEFHMVLSEAAGNPILNHLMSSFVALMHETRSLRLLVTNPLVTQALGQQHNEIYLAIRARNPDLASQKVEDHLGYIQKTVHRLLSHETLPTLANG